MALMRDVFSPPSTPSVPDPGVSEVLEVHFAGENIFLEGGNYG
jgi:hypothetical protein